MTNGAVSQDILVLHPQDNVAVARRDVPAGKAVRTDGYAAAVVTCKPIRFGHQVADRIAPLIRSDAPNIDGVVALTHKRGCAMEYGGEGHRGPARR